MNQRGADAAAEPVCCVCVPHTTVMYVCLCGSACVLCMCVCLSVKTPCAFVPG